jgi:LysR family glycine cleavage system transcriptional activator
MANWLPSLNGLQVFEAAARHLSFTRAAAELHVTQTAVSHQIRRLEEQLGIKLFVRRNRALALTREAEDYLPAIRAAFEDLHRATDRLLRQRGDEVLSVSTTISLAAKWLVPRLGAFQDSHPGIEVRISTSTRLVDLQREEIDLAIRYGRGGWPDVRADWLMAEDIFPVCSPALLTGAKPLRTPADLANHTLLHVTITRDEWQLWLTAAGAPPQVSNARGLIFDERLMALQAATDGLGVALGRRRIVEADLAAGRLVAPFGTVVVSPDAGYYLVTPQGAVEPRKVALFRTWLTEMAQAELGILSDAVG